MIDFSLNVHADGLTAHSYLGCRTCPVAPSADHTSLSGGLGAPVCWDGWL